MYTTQCLEHYHSSLIVPFRARTMNKPPNSCIWVCWSGRNDFRYRSWRGVGGVRRLQACLCYSRRKYQMTNIGNAKVVNYFIVLWVDYYYLPPFIMALSLVFANALLPLRHFPVSSACMAEVSGQGIPFCCLSFLQRLPHFEQTQKIISS